MLTVTVCTLSAGYALELVGAASSLTFAPLCCDCDIAVYPAEAIVVLLDVSNSMMLEAYPAEEAVIVPTPGHIRVRCASLLSQFVAEVPEDCTVEQFGEWLRENQGIPLDTELLYGGEVLDEERTLQSYNVGRYPGEGQFEDVFVRFREVQLGFFRMNLFLKIVSHFFDWAVSLYCCLGSVLGIQMYHLCCFDFSYLTSSLCPYVMRALAVFCNTSEGFPPTECLSRLDVVKALFHALANRSMAYTYKHVIGLTLFGSDVRQTCDLTELFVNFQVPCAAGWRSDLSSNSYHCVCNQFVLL